jgi:glycosyltransferase involved in cell wall biosynthesis
MKIFRLAFDEITDKCRCGQCYQLGLVSPFQKVREDYERSLVKLDQDLVTEVLFPCHAPLHEDYERLKQQVLAKGKKVKQIVSADMAYDYRDKINDEQKRRLVVASDDPSDLKYLQDWHLILLVSKDNRKKLLKQIGQAVASHHYIYVAPKTKMFDRNLSPRSAYHLIKKFKKAGLILRPMPGLSVFETRAPVDIEFEPIAIKDNKKKYLLSIIIPVYNQKIYLMETLRLIGKQKGVDFDNIEVIIIDDGSEENSEREIKTAELFPNITYRYFKRYVKRSMGDFRFRAGIARNLGHKYSSGDYLLFLDADVLLPDDALKKLLQEVVLNPLVQLQRFDLTSQATQKLLDRELFVDSINEDHLITIERQYWYDFFKNGDQWNSLKHPWKYICTYGLCLSRFDFEKLGGFRSNYLGYGFEDTDLGLRFQEAGGKFYLSRVKAYHQYHAKERSEFKDSSFRRKRVLSRTAKTFYYNNLKPEIYECLRSYM